MDVILGLPGETGEHMEHTMKEIAALNPENITVHTLAVKRASAWKESFQQYDPSRKGLAEEMADICRGKMDRQTGNGALLSIQAKIYAGSSGNIGYACREGMPVQHSLYG
jgi:hypothetical protein